MCIRDRNKAQHFQSTKELKKIKSFSLNKSEKRFFSRKPKITQIGKRKNSLANLINDLRNNKDSVRAYAASALGQYPEKARTLTPFLEKALFDSSKYVRRNAAKSLGNYGSFARQAVPSLIKTLKDRDKYVAHSAANALKKIGTSKARLALTRFRDRII